MEKKTAGAAPKVPLHMWMDPELYQQLSDAAYEDKISKAEITREGVRMWLALRDKRKSA